MHEATQRRLVRTTFVLSCLAPTLGVVGWAIAWRLDWHAARLQHRLGQQLGLVVRAARVSHPQPNIVRMDRVRLLDPETGETLVSLDQLELSDTPDQVTIAVRQATLDAGKTQRLGHLVRGRLASQTAAINRKATLLCGTLAVVDDSAGINLYRVTGLAQSLASSVEARLSFAMDEQPAAPRVELAMVRDREQDSRRTRIDLNTGSLAVPLALVSPLVRHRLGATAVFQGTCRVEYRNSQWHRSVVSGTIDQVECERWIVDPIPYRFTGQGSVDLRQLEIGPRGIEQAVGRIQIEHGTIDAALLQSLEEFGLLTLDEAIKEGDDDQPLTVREVAIDIRMDVKGLTIRAPRANVTLNPAPRPIAIREDGKAILEPKQLLPVDRLVFAIVPVDIPDAYQVARRFQQILPRPPPRDDRAAAVKVSGRQ